MAIIESLPLCIALALSSGLCQTLSTACTAYPAYLDRIVNENDETDSSSMAGGKEEVEIFDDDSEAFADDYKYSSRSEKAEDAPVETGNLSLEQKAKKVSKRKWVLAYVGMYYNDRADDSSCSTYLLALIDLSMISPY